MRPLLAAVALAVALPALAQFVGPPVRYPPIDTEPKKKEKEKEKEKHAPPKPPDERPLPDVETLSGEIRALDPGGQELTLEADGRPIRIQVDRNTMVFLEARQGTIRDLKAGLPVRASVTGPNKVAFWVEVRPPGEPSKPAAADASAGASGGADQARSPDAATPPPPSPLPPSSTQAPSSAGRLPGGGMQR
jgi:hypothetical protein